MGRNGKDSGMAERGTKQRHTAVRGSLVSACEAGMKRTTFREGNAEHGLQEHGKAEGKLGRHFVQKMVVKETRFEDQESR